MQNFRHSEICVWHFCSKNINDYNKIYRVRPIPVSADTCQYRWVLVLADTYLSIAADTSSPVVCLPFSTVNTVAKHTCSCKHILYFHAYTPHTYITCTYLYPAQNRIFSTKNLYSQVSVSV